MAGHIEVNAREQGAVYRGERKKVVEVVAIKC